MKENRIGFIGTGIMGAAMVRNLLKARFNVTIYSRTKSKAEGLIKEGAVWVDSPSEVAKLSGIVITCVTDTADVRKVLLGEKGVIEGARGGLICIDMSTVSPVATKEMGAVLAKKGTILLDAPISGGEVGAIKGKLSIMVGGDKKVFDQVMPVFEAMGSTIIHCGPLGAGQMMKLVNQVMVIHTIMSIAEGFAFAEKCGLDLETTYKVTSAGAAASHSLKALGPKIIAGDFKPAFMVDLQMKDLKLILELSDELKQPLPGVALVKELMMTLQAQGRGSDGTQALIDVIRQLSRKAE